MLRTGLSGSLALACLGRLAPGVARAETQGESPAVWSPMHRVILRRTASVVLSSVLPVESEERGAALDEVVNGSDDYMGFMPLPVQAEAREALDLLDNSLVRWLLGGMWARWEVATPADVAGLLESLRGSRFDLKRLLYQFLHDMSSMGWFGNPRSWPALNYPGPPRVRRPRGKHSA